MVKQVEYSPKSPYFNTTTEDNFLDVRVDRPIPRESDDTFYTITQTYAYRPDLLAFDLYGSPRLWWVFAQRNPNEIEDSIYDFAPGVTIQLPKLSNLKQDLGI